MPLKRASLLTALFVSLCLALLAPACGGGSEEDDAEGDASAALPTYAWTNREGTVSGTVNLEGTAPARALISMDADANCARTATGEAMSEEVVASSGKLQNAFVYVLEGRLTDGNKALNSFAFPSDGQPRQLDQHGCHYVPHVIGIQTRDRLQILNSDQTTHNVNLQAQKNDKFNQSQTPGQAPIEYSFKRPETLVPVKCNQHPWMRAYIGVLPHPFFAVSGADGSFTISRLPPGTYTLVAWHEKFKEQRQQITVGPSEAKTGVNFNYNAATASLGDELDGGSLRVMPALEVPLLGAAGHQH